MDRGRSAALPDKLGLEVAQVWTYTGPGGVSRNWEVIGWDDSDVTLRSLLHGDKATVPAAILTQPAWERT